MFKRIIGFISAHKLVAIIIGAVIIAGGITAGVFAYNASQNKPAEDSESVVLEQVDNESNQEQEVVANEPEATENEELTATGQGGYVEPAQQSAPAPTPTPQPSAEEIRSQNCEAIYNKWYQLASQFDVNNTGVPTAEIIRKYREEIQTPYAREMDQNDCNYRDWAALPN